MCFSSFICPFSLGVKCEQCFSNSSRTTRLPHNLAVTMVTGYATGMSVSYPNEETAVCAIRCRRAKSKQELPLARDHNHKHPYAMTELNNRHHQTKRLIIAIPTDNGSHYSVATFSLPLPQQRNKGLLLPSRFYCLHLQTHRSMSPSQTTTITDETQHITIQQPQPNPPFHHYY